jgi:hypothetical protein
MVAYRKKNMKKSPLRKVSVKRAVSKVKTNRLVKLIKRISLKQSETKNTHSISENLQLYHNVPYIISNQLYLAIGSGDDQTGTGFFTSRIGDEVIARGVSYKFWFANKLDRPNVMYKIIFYKYQSATATPLPANAPWYIQGTSNYMIRDIDAEKYKILKVVKFNLQTSAQRITAADTFYGAEGHRAVSVWIPLKSMKLKYENNSTTPKFADIGFSVVAYDSYGTLSTDNIASFAVNRKFYFKDP